MAFKTLLPISCYSRVLSMFPHSHNRSRAVWSCLVFTVACASIPSTSTAVDEHELTKIVKGVELQLTQGKKRLVCQSLLGALKGGTSIRYVEPTVETSDFSNPRIQEIQATCPELQLNKHLTFSHKTPRDLVNQPQKLAEQHALNVYIGTKDFRLYDFDSSLNGDGEILFYDGGLENFGTPAFQNQNAGIYRVIDTKSCQTRGSMVVGSTFSDADNVTVAHGVIQFQRKYYIYGLDLARPALGSLRVYGWRTSQSSDEKKLGQLCVYRPVISENN
jgi:hypothetical protein